MNTNQLYSKTQAESICSQLVMIVLMSVFFYATITRKCCTIFELMIGSAQRRISRVQGSLPVLIDEMKNLISKIQNSDAPLTAAL
jgi:hypothetical protein